MRTTKGTVLRSLWNNLHVMCYLVFIVLLWQFQIASQIRLKTMYIHCLWTFQNGTCESCTRYIYIQLHVYEFISRCLALHAGHDMGIASHQNCQFIYWPPGKPITLDNSLSKCLVSISLLIDLNIMNYICILPTL